MNISPTFSPKCFAHASDTITLSSLRPSSREDISPLMAFIVCKVSIWLASKPRTITYSSPSVAYSLSVATTSFASCKALSGSALVIRSLLLSVDITISALPAADVSVA